MICMKCLRFSGRPRAKVRCQGPLGSARALPFSLNLSINNYLLLSDEAEECFKSRR